jgi:hypothetical protein
MRFYRTWLLACVAAWFLIGLHMPAIHEMTHHGQELPASVFGAVVLLALVGMTGLWQLLRLPAPSSGSSGPSAGA